MTDRKRMPVTVLAGFLGAGKTTLLKQILQGDHGLRIAVVVNEFAEVGIDGDLVKNVGDNPMVEMNNGCICCSLLGGLGETLDKLAKQSERFDYVVIETTGLADPGPIAHTFMAEGPARESFALDGIITLVDAKHYRLQSADQEHLWGQQVVTADVVLLNKLDLIGTGEVAALRQFVHVRNPLAVIHETERAGVDLRHILGRGKSASGLNVVEKQHDHHADCDHDHGHCNHDHDHDHDHVHHHDHDSTAPFASVCLVEEGDLDPGRFNAWFGGLLRTAGTKLPRAKGILSLQGRGTSVIIQSVFEQTETTLGEPWADGTRLSKMVIIGKREVIDRETLVAGFRACMISA